MKYLLLILSFTFTQQLDVDGNLVVTGTIEGQIKNDSLAQVISQLEARIQELETLFECYANGIPEGYCDCFGTLPDICGECGGNAFSSDECDYIDADGNSYSVVQIGDQIWMAENLKVEQYIDGKAIGVDSNDFFYYYADSVQYSNVYGNLYNWYSITSDRGLCNEGWHIPTDFDWKVLEQTIGMSLESSDSTEWRGIDEGLKLKQKGSGNEFDRWNYNGFEYEGTNDFEFSVLPSGSRDINMIQTTNSFYYGVKDYGVFWALNDNNINYRQFNYNKKTILRRDYYDNSHKEFAFSVRCVKD